MLLVNYSVFVKESGELVETTLEDVARQYRKYREGEDYSPGVVVVGEGRFIKGFEEALRSAEEGREYEVSIPPEKAYGSRDSSKVRTYPRRFFIRNNIVPEVGKEVTVNNVTGRIIAVEGGRVVVDFNHPLAGKTLLIKFKIEGVLTDPIDRIKYLVKRRLKDVDVNKVDVKLKEETGTVTVELPREFRFQDGIQIIKFLASRDIVRWVSAAREVIFIDRFTEDDFKGVRKE